MPLTVALSIMEAAAETVIDVPTARAWPLISNEPPEIATAPVPRALALPACNVPVVIEVPPP